MAFFLKAKKLDITVGQEHLVVVLNTDEAWHLGIKAGDRIKINWRGQNVVASANLSREEVKRGQIGFYKEVWKNYPVEASELVEMHFVSRPPSIEAIKKKLLGHSLSYEEIENIIKDIVNNRLSMTEIAYFVASGFVHDYSNEELFYLTKATAKTGETLKFRGVVVDKHSIGGLPGNRTTMVTIPIIASLGLTIPKTSSRAITSPAGTADTMEVLAPVALKTSRIKSIVQEHHSCIVWGGGLNLAPADDKIIQVSYPLSLEPYSKMLVSIMAKKVACDIKYLIIDVPVGPTAKVPNLKVAKMIREKFLFLAKKFDIKCEVVFTAALEPIGRGVGPALEARDVLRVLQQKENRPLDLEKKSIFLSGKLLELCGKAKKGQGIKMATAALKSGQAWKKMQEIITAQGGNGQIDSEKITLSAVKSYVNADKTGKVRIVDNKRISEIARILGTPLDKLAGLYLNVRLGQKIKKGDRIFTMYAANQERINMALAAIKKLKIYTIK
ncbi:MAG: AMP phosphorylase [Candidatus Buchananbacteria bacterium]